MSTLTYRRNNPITDMLGWIGNETEAGILGLGLGLGMGLSPLVRVEDFVEDGTYVLRAEMPGIDPDKDIEIDVADDVLTISGERKVEEQDRIRHEFHYGSFSRSVHLPRHALVDEVKAEYRDGVLEVRVPLEEETTEARRITVTHGEG